MELEELSCPGSGSLGYSSRLTAYVWCCKRCDYLYCIIGRGVHVPVHPPQRIRTRWDRVLYPLQVMVRALRRLDGWPRRL